MRKIFILAILLVSCSENKNIQQSFVMPSHEVLEQMAKEESKEPVHPGIPGMTPFWNTYAKRFIFAPAFDFEEVDNADAYRFKAISAQSKTEYVFDDEKPWAVLSPVWGNIPVGFVDLKVEALQKGEVIDVAGERSFYKAAHYSGPYHKVNQSYQVSIDNLLKYLFNASYMQYWLENKAPDMEYGLYSYPSKMFSAVIQGMLMITKSDADPSMRERALEIANIVADHLIELSEPEGRPLEFLPPTYTGPIYADMKKEYRGESLADRIMMIYPASVAKAYLDLYDVTNERRFFDAAIRIAVTYRKLQLDNGSWYLLIYRENGLPVAGNYVVPMGIKSLMDRLKKDYNITGYETCSRRALEFVERNLADSFNWEGQFEDQKPSERYKNLSKGQACSYALHLMNTKGPGRLEEALELVRFAEDQFVIWEQPIPTNEWGIKSDGWLMPCVLEQYNFYTPVNASSANMIEVFRTAHQKTGNPLYLAKAIDLANTIIHVQNPETGHYPTYLVRNLLDQEGWINCMVYAAKAIQELDDYLKEIGYQ